ncbi:unnamed protein product [Rotaria sp. Silwood2]|nr:unnamed protein product [Rotaria sp. Silwood2]
MVEYFDQNRWRPILYRAAISEMWVPYGDSSRGHSYKNAYDVGEAGMGLLTNSLVLGCDCLGEIRYLDAVINNNQGQAILLKNAVCIHEEDIGILWKHTEFVTQRSHCRRLRRLVVSSIITVGNYEYGLFWYFLQDGAIHFEAKLTGIIAPGAIESGQTPVSGGLVAEGLYGPHHQHFFNMRIDWMLDGINNSLVEINCEPLPRGPDNPEGNAWIAKERVLETVGEARRQHDATKGRFWKIINPKVKNHVNQPVGYKLVPSGPACYPLCDLDSTQGGRSALARYHLWGTRYHPEEFFAGGQFPNQSKGDDGVAVYSEKHKDESLVECDLVTCLAASMFERNGADNINLSEMHTELYILGVKYKTPNDSYAITDDIISRFWFTYRSGFAPIGGPSGPTKDAGWGCMMRCGQMMLAEAYLRFFLPAGRYFRWRPNITDPMYWEILNMFIDKRHSSYSIHQIVQMGNSEGKTIGQWFGPNTIAQVLRRIASNEFDKQVHVHVAMDNTLVLNEIR